MAGSKNTTGQSFDRLRPRDAVSGSGPAPTTDREGKRALFSEVAEPPAPGSVALLCPRCDSRSVVPLTSVLRVSFPAVPALIPGQGFRANMKCPACGERGWMTVAWRK